MRSYYCCLRLHQILLNANDLVKKTTYLLFIVTTLLITACTQQQHTLSIQILGNGTVTSQPTAIQCGQQCSASFTQGSAITLNLVSPANWALTTWSGCDSTSGNSCSINMQANRTITVRLDPNGPISSLPGNSASSLTNYLPTFDPPAPDTVDLQQGLGFSLYNRDLIASISSAASVGSVNQLLTDISGEIVGGDQVLGLLYLRVPQSSDLEKIYESWAIALAHPATAAVGLNFQVLEDRLPPHTNFTSADERNRWNWEDIPIGAGNWGHKMIRVPQAWNMVDHARRTNANVEILLVEGTGYGDPTHPDLNGQVTVLGPQVSATEHGTVVAGIVGALFTNRVGGEGVYPRPLTMRMRWWSGDHRTWIRGIALTLLSFPNTKIVGGSIRVQRLSKLNSTPPNGTTPDVTQIGTRDRSRPVNNSNINPATFNPSYRHQMDLHGDLWKTVLDRIARQRSAFLLIDSAGNDNRGLRAPGYAARDTDPVANLAHRHPGDQRYISVEATRFDGQRAVFSEVGGTVSAPGQDIRSTEINDGNNYDARFAQWRDPPTLNRSYATQSGTSFASPHVTATAAYLLSMDPSLTAPELYSLLTRAESRAALVAGPPPPAMPQGVARIDTFGAVMAIDLLRTNKNMQKALVDVDDGTRDGNLRLRMFPNDPDPDHIWASHDERRGDDRISMRDFRAWRDAFLQINAIDFSGSPPAGPMGTHAIPGVQFDGPNLHFKRDLNFDGCVREGGGGVATPPHSNASDQPAPSNCAHAQPESIYARYDFNGNGRVEWEVTHPFKTNPGAAPGTSTSTALITPPGNLRDVDVLADASLWKVVEVDGFVENVYVDPAKEGTGGGLPVYPPPETWGVHRYLLANREGGTLAPQILHDTPDYIHSMDFHIEINWDALSPLVTHILIGQDWPLQSEISPDRRDNDGDGFTDERFEVTFDRSIRRPRPAAGGREYLIATMPLWTGWVRWNWNTEGGPVIQECRHNGRVMHFAEDYWITIPDDGSGRGGNCT